MRMIGIGLSLASSALLASCANNSASCDCLPQAQVKLMNTSAGAGPVDLIVADRLVASGIPVGLSSPAVYVPSGSQRVAIRRTSGVVAQFTTILDPDRLTAIVLSETGAVPLSIPLDTGNTASATQANVRLVTTGAPSNGELLHVWFNDAGTPTLSLAPATYGYGPFHYFEPGPLRVRFTPYGATSVVAEASVQTLAGRSYAVVLTRSDAGRYSAAAVSDP